MKGACLRAATVVAVLVLSFSIGAQHEISAAEHLELAGGPVLGSSQASPGGGSGGNTAAEVVKSLGKVTRILGRAAARLDSIAGSYEPPPDDERQDVIDALDEVIAEATLALATATELQRRTR